jgi:hypothetical protein
MKFKRIVISLFIMVSIAGVSIGSNPIGNEWINYQQKYFVVKVFQDGVYRIDYNVLANAGIPLGTFDPRSFQIFNKGQEQPIIVSNEQSGIFQPGDFIEFHGKKNDGWFDQYFYTNPESQPNPAYSLINDTASYYITWNNLINNKRFTVEDDSNFSGYTASPFFWFTTRDNYISNYFAGATNNYGVTDPEYTIAEGWFDAAFNLGQSRTKTLSTPSIFTTGPNSVIDFAVVGASNYASLNPDHHLRIQFAGLVIDTLYDGYKLLRFNRSVSPTALNPAGTQFVFSSINDLGSTVDRNTIAYIQVRYPRSYDLAGLDKLYYELPASSGTKTYTRFTNYNATLADNIWIYDFTNNKKIRVYLQSSEFRALIPSPTTIRHCLLTKESNFIQVASIKPVNQDATSFAMFRDFSKIPYLDSDYLLITHSSLLNSAENYKAYRESVGYKVLLVTAEELYHQFGYGIGKHPMALRNFARYTINTFSEVPKNLFLLGKSLTPIAYRKSSSNYWATFVPSFGNPPSDILITAGITGDLYEPAIATGRLAAKNNTHVQLYLEKVILYELENQTPQEWMKNILHFGGGSNLSEQNILANYLKQYQTVLEDTLFGGYVRTFLKSSTEPIQINQSDSLKQIINNGVSIMTFFGHAAGIGFDISIDYPSEYNNYGKYPFLVANSCFAGDIFGLGNSSSEEFVLIDGKGVIGYLASTSATGAFELNRYSDRLFKNLSSNYYGQSIGSNIKNTIKTIQSTNQYIKNVCLLQTLHGDPAIVINSQPKPDYSIASKDIFTSPQTITTEIDSFYVHIIATNIGKAIRDSIVVEIERVYPGGSRYSEQKRVKTPLYKDTLDFKIEVNRELGIGVNQIKVVLDAFNEIDEISKANNTATTNIIISSSDIIPVYPYKYAIVPNANITLKASTGNPFVLENDYVFQIDTNEDFNNPTEQIINSKGGVVTWTPAIAYSDSTVYYWRVSLKPEEDGDYLWRESSFQYINGTEGWSQAHFGQFKNNAYQYVTYNPSDKIWEFINSKKVLQAQTGIYPYIPWDEIFIKANGILVSRWSCLSDLQGGMAFAVFDNISGDNWQTINQGGNIGEYGNVHCSESPRNTFDFISTTESGLELMKDFINIIPEDHYILAYNHINHNASNYPEDLLIAFESLGSANIRTLQNNRGYLLFGQKGAVVGSANEVIGGSVTSIIQLTDSIETNWDQGYILSERIGPARNWKSAHWRKESFEMPDTDVVWLNILGIKTSGEVDTLFSNIPYEESDIYFTDKNIDATIYPYLQLMVEMMDDDNRTPAQMKRWQVIYDPVPETAINPSLHFLFESETLPEGKNLVFSTAIQNISDYDMDSLLVHYYVIDQSREVHMIEYARQRPHPAGDILIDTITFNTKGFAGNNSFYIEVNPKNDQHEQYHFNNIGIIPFYVEKDKSNPLLDVTFDGVRIMDGEIVSANPNIIITLIDENPYLILNDTSLVKVFMQYPGQTSPIRLYFHEKGVEKMRFYPATEAENKCRIEFNPRFSIDGKYKLLLQAIDYSRNESGKEDLSISFEIVTRSTITEILNWPNPFSDRTHFVFTLTGSEIPTFFKIQILTITGRVVREIDLSELGPIRIGKNITTYAWDGTDQYGDRLANGVYLYRVITNINEKPIEIRNTSAEKYFHKGFGKMYIIR